ncbi:cyclin-like protein, partial [Mycena leptocephala]
DPSWASEYAEDIFKYMGSVEEKILPKANYMTHQTELTWGKRQVLVDWLVDVHSRYHMLPETLWITVNIMDRFLASHLPINSTKLQLVGVTAMFIAAKYEEGSARSVEELVYMAGNAYNKREILRAEKTILQTLEFRISHYCSPYSWISKISEAGSDAVQTALGKFLTEVTLLDYRFTGFKPSLVAAVGVFSARRMLGRAWTSAFEYSSGYTEEQLTEGRGFLLEKL